MVHGPSTIVGFCCPSAPLGDRCFIQTLTLLGDRCFPQNLIFARGPVLTILHCTRYSRNFKGYKLRAEPRTIFKIVCPVPEQRRGAILNGVEGAAPANFGMHSSNPLANCLKPEASCKSQAASSHTF